MRSDMTQPIPVLTDDDKTRMMRHREQEDATQTMWAPQSPAPRKRSAAKVIGVIFGGLLVLALGGVVGAAAATSGTVTQEEYTQGVETARQDGFDDGFGEGLSEGLSEGTQNLDAQVRDAYRSGYTDGYEDGRSDAGDKGKDKDDDKDKDKVKN